VLFNSISFLIYFPIVTALYFLLPHPWRWLLLLAASCVFYMAFIPVYILILAFTIGVDYIAGILISRATGTIRRVLLAASIVSNISVLFVFKYFNFFAANTSSLAAFLGWNYPVHTLALVLPIGLSFHTFQAMSYTIEVYRGRQEPEYHFGIFALYVMFYPQLVAGPIERPYNLLPQLRQQHAFDAGEATAGLHRMLWGMYKKVVIADNLAGIVNMVYSHPRDYTGFPLLLATIAFSLQIYCDFSGYSDVAIGTARVMGFRLSENFTRPYFATSIGEFWRRWHISLSSWFRDYLYIPLGGGRASLQRRVGNICCVFVVSGLWHGANWTFIVWGTVHGLYLAMSVLTESLRRMLRASSRFRGLRLLDDASLPHRLLCATVTFSFVTFAWVFFRANSFGDAVFVLTNMSLSGGIEFAGYWIGWKKTLVLSILVASVLISTEAIRRGRGFREVLLAQPAPIRWAAYAAATWLLMNYGAIEGVPFIYFQF